MAGVERMTVSETTRTIATVKAKAPASIALRWSDGTRAEIDLSNILRGRALRARDGTRRESRGRRMGAQHRIAVGAELSAERCGWKRSRRLGREDTRAFLEWRLKHGLSLTKAAEALGLSRRMVAYYSNGEKPVPRPILLACKGWEVERRGVKSRLTLWSALPIFRQIRGFP